MIILAAIFLNIGHPGLIFDPRNKTMASAAAATAPAGDVKDEQYSSSDEARENSRAVV